MAQELVADYRRAAEEGNLTAQLHLALAYWEGRGAPQDYIEAHAWFNLAAAQGDGRARESRDKLARQMTRTQIGDAQRRARRRLDKAAEAIIAAVEREARELP